MKVVVIRHGKVRYAWEQKYSSQGFDKACEEYDISPIEDMEYRIPEFKYAAIYASTLLRSRETAKRIFPGRSVISTELIDEVPLRSSFNTNRKMSLGFWDFTGRLQWSVNSSRQREGKKETKKRARAFAKLLCQNGEDSAVVTHGFYMHTLLKELKQAGFTMDQTQVNYQNGSYVIAEK